VVVVVAGVGLFASGPTPRRAETARELYVDAIRVGFGALALGGFRALAPAERAFIETWEAEVYRLSIDAG
jgi:rhamnose utilization protein RhaD (predicted bifunctional aldolase and dehydrogenase)